MCECCPTKLDVMAARMEACNKKDKEECIILEAVVKALGVCEPTQRDKFNFQRACRHFVMNTDLGVFAEFHY